VINGYNVTSSVIGSISRGDVSTPPAQPSG
jgi:hypothetical protein